MAKLADDAMLQELYDAEFIAGLPAFDPAGNPHLVALLKDPTGKFSPAATQIARWYNDLSGQSRLHYCNRLRSQNDGTFIGAVWELYVHHFLSSVAGMTVDELEYNTGRGSIDYLVEYDGETIRCEALALLRAQRDTRLDKRLQVFREHAEALMPPGYVVSVAFVDNLTSQPQAKLLAEWLAEELRSQPRQRGDSIGKWEPAGSRLSVQILAAGGQRPSHVLPFWSSAKDDSIARVLDRVRRKAHAKRPGSGRFLLFVGYRGIHFHDDNWLDLCYGPATFRLHTGSGYSLPLPGEGGLFTERGKDKLRATYLSGIVTSPMLLSPETGEWQFSPAAYLNPFAERPVHEEILSAHMPVWTPDATRPGELRRLEPPTRWSRRIQAVINKIRDEYAPEKIVIFGSHASGQPTDDSDLDILVVKATDKRELDRVREVSAILTPRDMAVDIFVKTPEEIERGLAEGNTFLSSILSTGKVVYEREGSQ